MLNNILPPYHSLQELNLDWILTKIKNILRFIPDDGSVGQILRRTPTGAEWSNEQGGGGAVDSVNGKTGVVVLDKTDIGLGNVDNVQQYSSTNPPPYPVTSVNGQTGAVIVSGGAVDSVNGQTGTVVLTKSDVGLGNVDNVQQYSSTNPPPYPVTSVNGQTGAVTISKSDVGLGNVDNVQQYSSTNPPPYPVTSVNGQTGAVSITIPTITKTIVKGQIMRGAGAGAEGYGVAEITYMGSLVRIDFAMKLETASYTGDDYGIDPTLLDATITPIEGGTITYFKSNGTMDTDRMGYGGTFENRNNTYWKPARIYTTGGAVGSWAANVIGAGETLVGTCFGIKL